MEQRKPLPGLWVVAGYALAAACLAHLIVRYGWPALYLNALVVPVIVASLFYRRIVYLSLVTIAVGLSVSVIVALYSRPFNSLRTLTGSSITMLVVCEVLHTLVRARWRTEQRLWETSERLKSLVNASPVAIFAVNADGRVESWNPAAERIFGWTEIEILGRELPFEAEDAPGLFRDWHKRLMQGEPLSDQEVRCRRKNGRPIAVSISAAPLYAADKGIVGVMAVVADVTQRLEAAEHARAAEEARRADRAKDEFLAVLAHELRNPLAAISNAGHVLEGRGAPDAASARLHSTIVRQSAHLSRLVDDLLDVARISSGKIELRHEVVDLREVARHAVETARGAMSAPGPAERSVTLELPDLPVPVWGDPTRLEQVLLNLLSNAAKYTDPAGRIWVTVATASLNENGRMGEWENGGLDTPIPPFPHSSFASQATISVRDNGTGIAHDLLPRVFDLFIQEERSLDRAQGGLGIGLTLVRSLVELHGGRVRVHSDGPGQGSEFTITLPVCGTVPEHPNTRIPEYPAPNTQHPTPNTSPKVLVVDDNAEAAETLGELLELWGYSVSTAHNGEEALATFEAEHPTAVLLDIGLPGIDGYEVARIIRSGQWTVVSGQCSEPGSTPTHPHIHTPTPPNTQPYLIALTGYGQDEDRRRALDAGCDAHLAKPAPPDTLKRLLEEAVGPGCATT